MNQWLIILWISLLASQATRGSGIIEINSNSLSNELIYWDSKNEEILGTLKSREDMERLKRLGQRLRVSFSSSTLPLVEINSTSRRFLKLTSEDENFTDLSVSGLAINQKRFSKRSEGLGKEIVDAIFPIKGTVTTIAETINPKKSIFPGSRIFNKPHGTMGTNYLDLTRKDVTMAQMSKAKPQGNVIQDSIIQVLTASQRQVRNPRVTVDSK
ncbi:hypothetical protein BY996DRAFT_6414954 [Phakopsora pachyrhizi]|nr:hypothetical protein BY996DRAFT_6414954 [Phakopsora pachyrhizi]